MRLLIRLVLSCAVSTLVLFNKVSIDVIGKYFINQTNKNPDRVLVWVLKVYGFSLVCVLAIFSGYKF